MLKNAASVPVIAKATVPESAVAAKVRSVVPVAVFSATSIGRLASSENRCVVVDVGNGECVIQGAG